MHREKLRIEELEILGTENIIGQIAKLLCLYTLTAVNPLKELRIEIP